MAARASTVCSEPGCPDFVTTRSRCAKHQPTNTRWKPYNAAWRRKSAAIRKARPTCERCHVAPSTHVHHKDGLGPDGPRGLEDSNLEALCTSCHSRETARDGFGTTRRTTT